MGKVNENENIVVVKDSFFTKIAKAFKKIFSRNKDELFLNEGKDNYLNYDNVELITSEEAVQLEISDARRAFRKYVINNKKGISDEVFNYIQNKLFENESEINKLIEINGDDITFKDILESANSEERNIQVFKTKNKKSDGYNVPIGVIGIECDDCKSATSAIFKAVSTRNAIIILHNNYNKYSTEALILLIVKECLKNFFIDDNIIQMLAKEEIDFSKLDKVIYINNEVNNKPVSKNIIIYQEDDSYASSVQDEVDRLEFLDEFSSFDIKVIKGEFGNVINYFSNLPEKPTAVCMYTNNSQKAYKFINWINCPNVFVNTGIKSCESAREDRGLSFANKFVLHEGVF